MTRRDTPPVTDFRQRCRKCGLSKPARDGKVSYMKRKDGSRQRVFVCRECAVEAPSLVEGAA